MKWSVVALFAVGIIAALSAAMLVGALRADAWRFGSRLTNPDVTVVVAAKAVTADTALDKDTLTTRTIPRDKAPEGAITNVTEVIGKVVILPLREGQPITRSSFAPEGTGPVLAASLGNGKRAVSIAVSDSTALDGVLYPGCKVDVIASFKGRGEDLQPMSTTLLENVQVLAIERISVVSPDEQRRKPVDEGSPAAYRRRVTLLVDMKQAKILQLAQDLGTLSLALRNSTDTSEPDRELVSVQTLGGTSADLKKQFAEAWANALPRMMGGTSAATTPATVTASAAPVRSPTTWDTVIIRGETSETKSFAVPTAGQPAPFAKDQ